MLKHTKIVATVSDKRCDVEFIKSLYEAGMNVVRLNTAHLGAEGLTRIVDNVRAVSNRIGILMDTKGPEVRTTVTVNQEPIAFKAGDIVTISGDPTQETSHEHIYVSYTRFVHDLSVGSDILIDDEDTEADIDYMVAGDAIMPGVLIAQAFGRWGNFFNQEAYGSAVSLDFLQSLHLPDFIINGMHINGVYYQPTFLYESVANVIGFLLIFFVIHKIQTKQGEQFFSYFIWYGIIRFFVEGLRTDSLYVMGFRTAQLVSIAFVIVGVIGFIYCKKRGKPVIKEMKA